MLERVSNFKYLEIILQQTVFIQHVTDRTTQATGGAHIIADLRKMSVKAVVQLFNVKIVSILPYGLQLIWEHLDINSLCQIEKVKATYLKKVLGLSKYAPSRTVYKLSREQFLIGKFTFLYKLTLLNL